jgi:hypothetical protein
MNDEEAEFSLGPFLLLQEILTTEGTEQQIPTSKTTTFAVRRGLLCTEPLALGSMFITLPHPSYSPDTLSDELSQMLTVDRSREHY